MFLCVFWLSLQIVNGTIIFIEGGQRPVTAAPLFWVLAVWDLAGMIGPVYVRKVRGCNRWPADSWQIPGRSWQTPGRFWQILADSEIWDLVFCVRPLWGVGNWETHAVPKRLNFYIKNHPKSIGVDSKNYKKWPQVDQKSIKSWCRNQTRIWNAKEFETDATGGYVYYQFSTFWHHLPDFGAI